MADNPHSRLIDLIDYARETTLMRYDPKADIADYKNFSEYEYSLQDLPGISFDTATADATDEIWLTVDRLRESKVPVPEDKLLKLWIEVQNDPKKTPVLKDSLTVNDLIKAGYKELLDEEQIAEPSRKITLSDLEFKEEVETNFKSYINNKWKPWSEPEKLRRRVITLYGKLFTLKQELEGGIVDAQLELVWGIGVAVWKMDDIRIRFPLITKLVDLSLNEDTMAIEIRPREMEPRIELEIYSKADNPGVPQVQKVAKEFFADAEETISPFDKSTFEGLLRSAATLLDSKGVYVPDEETPNQPSRLPATEDNLKVTDSWVLFARPRGASLFVQDLERFQTLLKSDGAGSELPEAVKAIVTEPSNINEDLALPSFRGISMVSGNDESSSDVKPKDLFFPLPFNDEQVKIVQLLDKSDGVVVQGPPGTGKTHTIANIICHYLALGKRVLVTSMREPALSVLQEKLPEDIRPLAVSLLMNEKKGMKQFQYAIEQIGSIVQSIEKSKLKREISQQEEETDTYHFKIAKCDRSIESWANANLTPFEIEGEKIEPRQAALEVVQNRDEIGWFEDSISIESKFDTQFIKEDIQKLREDRQILGNDLDYYDCKLPDPSEIPNVRQILEVHQNLSRLAELEQKVDTGEIPHLVNLSELTFKSAEELLKNIDKLKSLRKEVRNTSQDWTNPMLNRLRQNSQNVMV